MDNSIITFFPVGDKNGGMTLLRLNDAAETTILIDVCVGEEVIAENCDVIEELRTRLPVDAQDRPYVDAFILTHRHKDHLQGMQNQFHLGSMEDYPEAEEGEDAKIIIKELWSSYHFWKKSSPNYELCQAAKDFNTEMNRRVNLFKDRNAIQNEGERAIIIGKDTEGESDGLESISYEIGDKFTRVNDNYISSKFEGLILSPLYKQEYEDNDTFNDKNRQSIVLQLKIRESGFENHILLAADAECFVWETLWTVYEEETEKLQYDILQAPHHCSWHSFSYDSQSKNEDAKVNSNAKKALRQAKQGACIVAQCRVIKDDGEDPPSNAAKDEYLTIVDEGRFFCTNEYPNEDAPEPLEFNLTGSGPQEISLKEKSRLTVAALASTREAYPHG